MAAYAAAKAGMAAIIISAKEYRECGNLVFFVIFRTDHIMTMIHENVR